MLKVLPASHTDHVNAEIIDMIVEKFKERDGFFIETFEVKGGSFDCALYGPACGDGPITEARMEAREGREHLSRVIDAPTRKTNVLTVIAGPHESEPCVLYTAFGGPLSPKEPNDPFLKEEEREASTAFWKDHALAV